LVRQPFAEVLTAPKDLQSFVDKNRNSLDPIVQDKVGNYRIRLAYSAAAHKDFAQARTTLLQTAKEYRGTGAMSNDFGGVKDQALYQAAVCLIAEGKKTEGRAELVSLMRNMPASPLATAAYRRIERLDGKPSDELEALLQHDVAAREHDVKMATSMCGPKCVEHMFKTGELSGNQALGCREIAKMFGTSETGTSVEQMRKGLARLGHPGYAYELNMADLSRAPAPLVVMSSRHFMVMERRDGDDATVYDPQVDKSICWRIPHDDRKTVYVIAFQPLDHLN
jgi:hypothetical protein